MCNDVMRILCGMRKQASWPPYVYVVRQELLMDISSGPFWTHKIITKVKYISISNILHLLSAPASIPRVGAILANLVVE